jgi:tetrahydromethanopterin S-methyltransferase subunit F
MEQETNRDIVYFQIISEIEKNIEEIRNKVGFISQTTLEKASEKPVSRNQLIGRLDDLLSKTQSLKDGIVV